MLTLKTISKRKRIFAAVCISLIAILLAGLYNELTVTKYTLATDKIKQPIRVVLLADLHSCMYGAAQKNLITKIDEQNPDLILMAGDIAEDTMPHTGTIDLLKGIAGRYDCYYVAGNHEFWSGEIDVIKNFFREYGVDVLEGICRVADVRGEKINICGVDDSYGGKAEYELQLNSAFDSIDRSLYTIFLYHRPERFEQQSAYSFDLMLTGHAHGGQWRIPLTPIGLWSPDQGGFPKYTSGIYKANGKQMLVSRGLSRESTAIPRLFNPPELIVIDIVPE